MNDKKERKYFKLAKNASEFSDFYKCQIGAVLVEKNKVISVGWNAEKESPMQKRYNRLRDFDTDICRNSIHAEISCLSKAKSTDLNGKKLSIFVYREFKDGGLAMSRPCPACMQALKDLGIKNIYYTSEDGYVHEKIV